MIRVNASKIKVSSRFATEGYTCSILTMFEALIYAFICIIIEDHKPPYAIGTAFNPIFK